ncbi:segregation/condensation protein A [Bacillus alkalicellulosilyticus]|uniref:segregation/condensation protein A n=1 Tax=Alkalihalobacterium alkalicellulosilyticum TaxID=1912214 RepID=UPI000998580F|nr:segregation/condensation protein A [Bacillus alkalicellulosilyticus]
MNQYNVKLDAFEGPLDLLLHLINQAEVDIYDIPMAHITAQYMDYIHTMQELQLDVASEYLVMAATLLEIKSKMLLPKHQDELFEDEYYSEDEEDPRQELMNRLIEYRKYKEAAQGLQEREQDRALVHTKPPSRLDEYISDEERSVVTVKGVNLFDMIEAYQRMVKRKMLIAPRSTTVKHQEYSIDTRMGEVMEAITRAGGKVAFSVLFEYADRSELVVTFLALLELMKGNSIYCEQDENFADIMIHMKKEELPFDFE